MKKMFMTIKGSEDKGPEKLFNCPVFLSVMFFASCAMCFGPGRANAQNTVEVNSDVVPVESEVSLENVLRAKIKQKEQEQKEQEKKAPAQKKQAPALEVKTKLIPSNMPAGKTQTAGQTKGQKNSAMIDQQLIKAEQHALSANVINEDEMVRINKSLRGAIEQNRQLQEEKERMQQELGTLRGENALGEKRQTSLEQQIQGYQNRIKQDTENQKKLGEDIVGLQKKIKSREQDLMGQIADLKKKLQKETAANEAQKAKADQGDEGESMAQGAASGEGAGGKKSMAEGKMPGKGEESVVKAQESGLDVIRLIDHLDKMKKDMRGDEARVHYNMGTICFHQGKYVEAATEFSKAVKLDPSDANAHFNLAYVEGSFLGNYKKSVKHYRIYLRLDPEADDAALVKEKILEGELHLRTSKDRDVDREVKHDRLPSQVDNW